MEPTRVKVYGLFPRTRRRYRLETAIGVLFGLFLFAAWWFGWTALRQRLVSLDLPPLLRLIVAVLDWTPWILLAAAVCKGMEVLFVSRAFARKEAQNNIKESTPTTMG